MATSSTKGSNIDYDEWVDKATFGGRISLEEFLEFTDGFENYKSPSEYFGTDLIGQPILTLNVIGSLAKKSIIVGDKEIQVDPIKVNLGSLQFVYPMGFDNNMKPSTDFLNVNLKFKAVSSNNVCFDLMYYSTFDDGYDICDKIFAVWFGVVEGSYAEFDVSFILSPMPLFKAVSEFCLDVRAKSKDSEYKISPIDLTADLVLRGITDRKLVKKVIKQFKAS